MPLFRTLSRLTLNMTNGTINDSIIESSNIIFPPLVRFWTYLFFNTVSLLVSFFVLHGLLADRLLRRALNNHVIIVLLIIGLIYELTDIPWILHYNRTGVPLITSPIFYIIWVFVDYTLYSLQIALFAWATIERHILIFHDSFVSTARKRFIVHYLPIVFIIVYYLVYYSIIHFAPFCQNSFDSFLAGGIFIPCIFDRTFLGTWDLIVHQVVPTLIIVVFSVGLIIRVVSQKRRLHQPVTWRRHRKMTIQLVSISSVYMIFNFPWTFLIFAFQYGLSKELVSVPLVYTAYLYYYVIFFFPFVCCGFFAELRRKLLKSIKCNRKRNTTRKNITSFTRTH